MPHRPRTQVDTSLSGGGFRPAAGPVDAFAAPSAGSSLAQLGNALADLSPRLAGLAQTLSQKDIVEKQRAAEEQASADIAELRSAQITYRDARQQGIIQEHQDPIFRARYQELVGRNMAELGMSNWLLVRQSTLADATTLEEYDGTFNQFLRQFVEEHLGEDADEPALATAFQQTVEERRLADRRAFSQQAGARFGQAADDEFANALFQGTYNRLLAGDRPESLAAYAQAVLDEHLDMTGATGGHRSVINQRAGQALLDAAVQAAATSDIPGAPMAVFDALLAIETSPGNTLGASRVLQDAIQEARGQVLQNLRGLELLAAREEQEELAGIQKEAFDALFEQGSLVDLTPFQQRINELGLDPAVSSQFIRSLEDTRASLRRAADVSDPNYIETFLNQVWGNPSEQDRHITVLRSGMTSGDVSENDALRLYQAVQTAYRSSIAGGALDDPVYIRMAPLFQKGMGQSEFGMPFEASARLEQGQAAYNRAWRQWVEQNPNASEIEKEDYLLELSDRVKAGYLPRGEYGMANDVPRLTDPPEWRQGPVMSDRAFEAMEFVFGEGQDPQGLPETHKAPFFQTMERWSLFPSDIDRVLRMIEMQRPFFDTESELDRTLGRRE